MEILVDVVLPLSLAIIMFSLGVGLTLADFARVLKRPRAFAIGAVGQMLVLPVVGLVIVLLAGLPPEISAGIMLLCFCPGGVTSNIVSKLAQGDVALSVSLTAVVSLLSLLTVPALASWAVTYFMREAAPEINITGLTIAVFLIVTLPVLLGLALRRFAPGIADKIEKPLSTFATILFVVIVVAAVAANWALFAENFLRLGPTLIVLNLILLTLGYGVGRFAGLTPTESKTISVELGIQNGTMGIALAGLITGIAGGLSGLALASAVYGVTMYMCAVPAVLFFRNR